MSIFKKKDTSYNCENYTLQGKDSPTANSDAIVKILGSGCQKCNQLEKNTVEALNLLGLDNSIEHIKDFAEIAKYGVMSTPALVYNGKVLSYGRVPGANEISELIKKA